MNCWICGSEAGSSEHIIKASDMRAVFGHVTQNRPLFFNADKRRNEQVRGMRAEILKYKKAPMCAKCNNERTQPYDRAWERLSAFLRNRNPPIQRGEHVRLDRVFPGSVRRSMLHVHLFFVKLFGCLIVEHNIPIELAAFSKALLEGTAHPKVHLEIGPNIDNPAMPVVGRTQVGAANLNGRVRFATWFYYLDRVAVGVSYAEPGERRVALSHSWHPAIVTKRFRLARFEPQHRSARRS